MNIRRNNILKFGAIVTITAFLSLTVGGAAYSDLADTQERILNDSRTQAPSYVNIFMERARQISGQAPKRKGFMERALNYIQNKLRNRLADNVTDKAVPNLKKKSSGTASGTTTSTAARAAVAINPEIAEAALAEAAITGAVTTTLDNGTLLNVWVDGADTWFSATSNTGEELISKA